MAWYGENLFRAGAPRVAGQVRVCATDAAGNEACVSIELPPIAPCANSQRAGPLITGRCRRTGSPQEARGEVVAALQSNSDIVEVISEVVVLEQILIRNLPAGTKAALRARAKQRHRSVEAEARDVLTKALEGEPVTIVDLLGTDEGADIEFEPERLGLTARSATL